jgi:hypothetical protein
MPLCHKTRFFFWLMIARASELINYVYVGMCKPDEAIAVGVDVVLVLGYVSAIEQTRERIKKSKEEQYIKPAGSLRGMPLLLLLHTRNQNIHVLNPQRTGSLDDTLGRIS